MKVLVTGGSGGLGRYVRREFEKLRVEVIAPTRAECGVTRLRDVGRVISEELPNVVVHLAAFTDTELCGVNPLTAVAVNALGTSNVARWCAKVNANMIYMSTDAVFAGHKEPGPYDEESVPDPIGTYGWSKFAGEQAVAVLGFGGLIVRANFFSRHCNGKTSFAAYVVEEAKVRHSFGCYDTVQSTPVHASTIAKRIVTAAIESEHGVLHVGTLDAVNRVEQATMICAAYGLPTKGIVAHAWKRGSSDGRLAGRGISGTVQEEIAKMVVEEPL